MEVEQSIAQCCMIRKYVILCLAFKGESKVQNQYKHSHFYCLAIMLLVGSNLVLILTPSRSNSPLIFASLIAS